MKQAKDVIEATIKSKAAAAAPASVSSGGIRQPLPMEVIAALQRKQKIEAVRLMREQTGLGLKEAKEAVEAYERTRAPTIDELSPGQVGDAGSAVWRVVILLLVALVVYLILRRLA